MMILKNNRENLNKSPTPKLKQEAMKVKSGEIGYHRTRHWSQELLKKIWKTVHI